MLQANGLERMRIALLTGPSGSGKTFVADQLRTQFDCLSYDRLMRDSIDHAFPDHAGDKWDKQIWLNNSDRLLPRSSARFRGPASGRCLSKAGSFGSQSGGTQFLISRRLESQRLRRQNFLSFSRRCNFY